MEDGLWGCNFATKHHIMKNSRSLSFSACHDLTPLIAVISTILLSVFITEGKGAYTVVVDSVNRLPLPMATIIDKDGHAITTTDRRGRMPRIDTDRYPLTIRYLGYDERTISSAATDTVFMRDALAQLPEVVIESPRHKLLHILAYVREYSTLTTYTDTVFLFREKMVDYMLAPDKRVTFKGWSTPRVLTSKSYYRFSNDRGLDSVSDHGNLHFSWSDWVGIPPNTALPHPLTESDEAVDTLHGKYSPREIWSKVNDKVTVDIDLIGSRDEQRWLPDMHPFFRKEVEFDRFNLSFYFDNVVGDSIGPLDIKGCSYEIESRGRGHDMFMFNKVDQPIFVNTIADVYFFDKEYIPVKEARKWSSRRFDINEVGIYEPLDAPDLPESILDLIDEVNNLDKEGMRSNLTADMRILSPYIDEGRKNFKVGRRALFLLKKLTGISAYKSHRNTKRDWIEFRRERLKHKNAQKEPTDR